MSILEKLKQASTKEEKVKALNEFLDVISKSEDVDYLEIKNYIHSRQDLIDVLSEMKKESKAQLKKSGGLKSLMAKIDEHNREHRPELVPSDPNCSLKERMELMKKYQDKNK